MRHPPTPDSNDFHSAASYGGGTGSVKFCDMKKIVLIRHGQSTYNKEKRFCGWTDADLTEQGIAEAHKAKTTLKEAGYTFDLAFTSLLKRANETLNIILSGSDKRDTLVEYSWLLNERRYGALQGLRHEDMAAKFSPEQVLAWRRSYSVKPLQLTEDDPRHPKHDPKYKHLKAHELPAGESLADTVGRVLPYWHSRIVPEIKAGKQAIVSASGNSLRALIKNLDNISDADIVGLEIATGNPVVYELEDETLKPIRHYYLC